MTGNLNTYCRRIRSILPVLSLIYLASSCAIKPNPIPVHTGAKKIMRSVTIDSTDSTIASVICSEFEKSKVYERVYCTKGKNEKSDVTIKIGSRIRNPSTDFWRNTKLSLYSFTTLLLVSTSATIDYTFAFYYRNRIIKTISYSTSGRIGVWAVQPPLMGFIGLSLGTILNDDKLPDRLQNECSRSDKAASPYRNENCRVYRTFVQDSLSTIWNDFLEKQRLFMESSEEKYSKVIRKPSSAL
ncbi:MAG: hypothetical protein GY866_33435 [Proteobacteria bacterium]|nr:hypothetical protein [Pseudomonadota bacterium]